MRSMTLAVVVLAACGGGATRVVQYAPPIAPVERPAPIVKVLEVSEPFQRDALVMTDDAVREQAPAKVLTPEDLVSDANLSSIVRADSGQNEGRRYSFRYSPGDTYVLPVCAGKFISVQLAVGEKLSRDPIMDDARGWSYDRVPDSGDGHGNLVTIMLFRPKRETREVQTVLVHTNIGQYRLDLQTMPRGDRCMSYVLFQHPERELAMLQRSEDEEADEPAPKSERRQAEDFDDSFACEIREGSPRWAPKRVSSFHGKTYVQFERDTIQDRDIPNVSADGAVASKFFDRHSSELVLDGLPNRILLQLGDKNRGYEQVFCRRQAR